MVGLSMRAGKSLLKILFFLFVLDFSLVGFVSCSKKNAKNKQKSDNPPAKQIENSNNSKALSSPAVIPYGYTPQASQGNILAFTFDDGPDDYGNTSRMVDFLVKNNIPATFFVNGDNWSDINLDGKAAIQYIIGNGFTLGNHTDHHCHLWDVSVPLSRLPGGMMRSPCDKKIFVSKPSVLSEITTVQDKVRQITNDPNWNMTLLRVPFGDFTTNDIQDANTSNPHHFDPNIVCQVAQYGVHVSWTIDVGDAVCSSYYPSQEIDPNVDPNGYQQQRQQAIDCTVNNFMQQLQQFPQGGIVLMHSPYPATLDALKKILTLIQSTPYQLVSVESIVESLYGETSDKIKNPDFNSCINALNDNLGTFVSNSE